MATFYRCDRCREEFDKPEQLKRVTIPKVNTTGYRFYFASKGYDDDNDVVSATPDLCAKCVHGLHKALEPDPIDIRSEPAGCDGRS